MDIDTMEAGLELNTLMAEKVMGWTKWNPKSSTERPQGTYWWQGRDPGRVGEPFCVMVADGPGSTSTFYPSTDNAAAGQLWEELKQRGIFFGVWSTPDGWDVENYETGENWVTSVDTYPLAVCWAALKAVESAGGDDGLSQ